MKGILIKGVTMPTATDDGLTTFLDARIYSDGSVLLPCGGSFGECTAEEVEVED